jgi:hypothetical protein
MKHTSIRLPDDLVLEATEEAQRRGFTGFNAFVRQAVRNEIDYRGSAHEEMEQRLAATLQVVIRMNQSIQSGTQATFALLMAQVRHLLMMWPDPPRDFAALNAATLNQRLQKILETAAADYHNAAPDFFEPAQVDDAADKQVA